MFYTGQRITGGLSTGLGNEGGLSAGGLNPLSDPKFKIPGGQPWNKTPLLPGKDTKKFEAQPLERPFQLPSALNPAGNVGALAQAFPPSAGLGGPMQLQGMPPGMQMEQPNVFSVRPSVSYQDPERGGLELGGTVNIPLGKQSRINVQGGYQPETNNLNLNATLGQPQGTSGFGIDFNMNRRLGQGGNFNDFGVLGRYGNRF